LEELGLTVADVPDGPSALRAVAGQAGAYDLVLVDQGLRGMDGEAVLGAMGGGTAANAQHYILLGAPGKPPVQGAAYDILPKPAGRLRLQACVARKLGAPRPRVAVPAAAADGFWQHDSVQRRVLLVEDHPVNQKVAMGILRKAGYRVDLASNGLSAIARAAQRQYDLILMDLQMPDMGGMEAAERIRAAETGARVPIVALTAHAMAGAREACMAQGMDDFIGKPIDARGFLGVVRNWLSQGAGTGA
jgi:CheY-like chemotaxis protein